MELSIKWLDRGVVIYSIIRYPACLCNQGVWIIEVLLPYRGKFSCGANFRVFRGQRSNTKIKTGINSEVLVISHAKLLVGVVSWHWIANIRTDEYFCWGLWSQMAKMCTRENFPAIIMVLNSHCQKQRSDLRLIVHVQLQATKRLNIDDTQIWESHEPKHDRYGIKKHPHNKKKKETDVVTWVTFCLIIYYM